MNFDKQEIKALADRVKTDRRFCADENHHVLADGVLALLAKIKSAETRLHDVAVLCATVEQERDQLKAENEALRKQIADLWPLKNVPPQDFRASNKCLACGEYHHGLGNLPCPRCTPVAHSDMAKEESHG